MWSPGFHLLFWMLAGLRTEQDAGFKARLREPGLLDRACPRQDGLPRVGQCLCYYLQRKFILILSPTSLAVPNSNLCFCLVVYPIASSTLRVLYSIVMHCMCILVRCTLSWYMQLHRIYWQDLVVGLNLYRVLVYYYQWRSDRSKSSSSTILSSRPIEWYGTCDI